MAVLQPIFKSYRVIINSRVMVLFGHRTAVSLHTAAQSKRCDS